MTTSEKHEVPEETREEPKSLQRYRDSLGEMAHETADVLGRVSERLSSPRAAALVAGGAAIGAALLFGVGPTIVGGAAAYAAYHFARNRKKQEATEEHPIGGA